MSRDHFILVADDDANDISMITMALAQKGARPAIDAVRDGAEVIDYLHARGSFEQRRPGLPQLVLLDLKMPRLDGWEVLRQVKGDERFKLVPIVIFSSSARESDIRQSYELGANAYVVKPIGYRQFVEALSCIEAFWLGCNQPPSSGSPQPAGEGAA